MVTWRSVMQANHSSANAARAQADASLAEGIAGIGAAFRQPKIDADAEALRMFNQQMQREQGDRAQESIDMAGSQFATTNDRAERELEQGQANIVNAALATVKAADTETKVDVAATDKKTEVAANVAKQLAKTELARDNNEAVLKRTDAVQQAAKERIKKQEDAQRYKASGQVSPALEKTVNQFITQEVGNMEDGEANRFRQLIRAGRVLGHTDADLISQLNEFYDAGQYWDSAKLSGDPLNAEEATAAVAKLMRKNATSLPSYQQGKLKKEMEAARELSTTEQLKGTTAQLKEANARIAALEAKQAK